MTQNDCFRCKAEERVVAVATTIDDRPTIRLMTGQTILMDDKAFVSTNRATKIVSTMVYNPINSIITMLGKANLIRDRALKLSANGFFCVSVIL